MLDWLLLPWQYPFMLRALIGAVMVGSICAIIGTYVVLRGMAFFEMGLVFPGTRRHQLSIVDRTPAQILYHDLCLLSRRQSMGDNSRDPLLGWRQPAAQPSPGPQSPSTSVGCDSACTPGC